LSVMRITSLRANESTDNEAGVILEAHVEES
jgi:hypothetical protein